MGLMLMPGRPHNRPRILAADYRMLESQLYEDDLSRRHRTPVTQKEVVEARSRSTVFAINLSHQVYFPEQRHVVTSGSGDLGISDYRSFDERRAYLDF